MANVFIDLPLPAPNGPGASVASGTMGKTKTIVVAGDFPGATIVIEASVDGGTVFAPVVSFQNGEDKKTVDVAAALRARLDTWLAEDRECDEPQVLSRDVEEELRALGTIE